MKFSHNRIDLEKTPAADSLVDFITRAPGDIWLVVRTPLSDLSKPVDWGRSLHGAKVPVPLVPYAVEPSLDVALGYMLQLGARLVGSIEGDVAQLHLSVGTPVTEEAIPGGTGTYWRYYLGFAVLLQK